MSVIIHRKFSSLSPSPPSAPLMITRNGALKVWCNKLIKQHVNSLRQGKVCPTTMYRLLEEVTVYLTPTESSWSKREMHVLGLKVYSSLYREAG